MALEQIAAVAPEQHGSARASYGGSLLPAPQPSSPRHSSRLHSVAATAPTVDRAAARAAAIMLPALSLLYAALLPLHLSLTLRSFQPPQQ